MLKMIKHAAKDTTGFILTLITGACLGAVITAGNLKYDVKTTLSFADIGGMLAGTGTIGVLILGLLWKNQIKYQHNRNVATDWYIESLKYNNYMKENFHAKLSLYEYFYSEVIRIREEINKLKKVNTHLNANSDHYNSKLSDYENELSPCVRIVVASFDIINKQGTVSENQWITKDIQVPLKKPSYRNSAKASCRDVSLQNKNALSYRPCIVGKSNSTHQDLASQK